MTKDAKQLHFADAPVIMGIVNVTPDSFSDGGKFFNADKAIEHGLQLIKEGATILDIGGESTRPGAQSVEIDEEVRRIEPVIAELSKHARYISIDTRNAKTMEAALSAGANIINDVSALTHDPDSIYVAASSKAHICLMHMQGTPQTMQEKPSYNNIIEEIYEYFKQRIKICEASRIDKSRLILDPGIGFGKTVEDNATILCNINKFSELGCPILLGTSRKSFIAKMSNDEPEDERLAGSLSSAIYGYSQGVEMFRVHDVKEHVQAFKIYDAIFRSKNAS